MLVSTNKGEWEGLGSGNALDEAKDSLLLSLSLYIYIYIYLYILRKLVIVLFSVKNTPKLINQQLKNRVKIVNWQKKVSYYFFYCQKYPYLKLKNGVKIIN